MLNRDGDSRTPWASHSTTTTHSPVPGRGAGRSAGFGPLVRPPPGPPGPARGSDGPSPPDPGGPRGPSTSVGIARVAWPGGPPATVLTGADATDSPDSGVLPCCGVGGTGISLPDSVRASAAGAGDPPRAPSVPVDTNGEGGARRSPAAAWPSPDPGACGCPVLVSGGRELPSPPVPGAPCAPLCVPGGPVDTNGGGGIRRSVAEARGSPVPRTGELATPTPLACRSPSPAAASADGGDPRLAPSGGGNPARTPTEGGPAPESADVGNSGEEPVGGLRMGDSSAVRGRGGPGAPGNAPDCPGTLPPGRDRPLPPSDCPGSPAITPTGRPGAAPPPGRPCVPATRSGTRAMGGARTAALGALPRGCTVPAGCS